jgi:hypothetical protein
MKRILTMLLLVSICSATTTRLPARKPLHLTTKLAVSSQPKGRWYMAQNGHAVYCFGPVVMVDAGADGIKRMATICRGGVPMVPLHD